MLGYCYYQIQQYAKAAGIYERLIRICPDIEEYRIYQAQSLLKARAYPEAERVSTKINSNKFSQRVFMLQVNIKYEHEDLGACKTILEKCLKDDPETTIASAAVEFKNGNFEDALKMFLVVSDTLGYHSDLAYDIALCYFKMEDYENALMLVEEIIKQGKCNHPDLFLNSNHYSDESKIGLNSVSLQESYIIEAYNLKAAIAFKQKEIEKAKAALNSIPARCENKIDPVTLHNQALIHMDSDPTSGLKKLNFLLSNPPFPSETFGNLLLLYCKFEYYDFAADILAQNSHLTMTFLSKELYDYLDAHIMISTSPEESYKKLESLATKHIEKMCKLSKEMSLASASKNKAHIKSSMKSFVEQVEEYIPVLMTQAKMHWERENYDMVECLFRQSAEFCSDHEKWKLNIAHVFFMQQGSKFTDAITYYAPFVKELGAKSILDVAPIVLANLCVSYIMTNQNEEAEQIMKAIESEEERLSCINEDKQIYHSCIVNLVIGTLYCEKRNFEFGISRICKSIEPCDKKLCSDTWFYSKRCLLALAESASKHMVTMKDSSFDEIFNFLKEVERCGKSLSANISQNCGDKTVNKTNSNIAQESRLLRQLFMRLLD